MPTTYQDALTNPLTAPTISGTTYTVDFLLNNPTIVTRIVANLVMANFFLDKVFSTGGDVQGGAVLYEQNNYLDVYTDRDVERIEPGAEAPIVGGLRIAPLVAQVEKFGGKFPITAEARRRNSGAVLNRQIMRLANTIVRKMQQRGLAELAAAISANSRTAAGVSWSDAMGLTFDTTAKNLLPGFDLAAAAAASENNEFGYSYDTIIANPTEAQSLRVVYGGDLEKVLADYGITNLISTPRKSATSVYLLAGGQVGEMRLEEPMRTTTADESKSAPSMVEQTWVQTLVNPVFFVTDPYAVLEITGLEA